MGNDLTQLRARQAEIAALREKRKQLKEESSILEQALKFSDEPSEALRGPERMHRELSKGMRPPSDPDIKFRRRDGTVLDVDFSKFGYDVGDRLKYAMSTIPPGEAEVESLSIVEGGFVFADTSVEVWDIATRQPTMVDRGRERLTGESPQLDTLAYRNEMVNQGHRELNEVESRHD